MRRVGLCELSCPDIDVDVPHLTTQCRICVGNSCRKLKPPVLRQRRAALYNHVRSHSAEFEMNIRCPLQTKRCHDAGGLANGAILIGFFRTYMRPPFTTIVIVCVLRMFREGSPRSTTKSAIFAAVTVPSESSLPSANAPLNVAVRMA